MRSPLGYCRAPFLRRRKFASQDCRRWVRDEHYPLRCPRHHDVPLTNVEEIGLMLKRVYVDSIPCEQNTARALFDRFASDEVKFGGSAYEFPWRTR